METSLLPDSGDMSVPFLSSGPPIEEEASEFSRLMALQNQEHILDFQRLIPEDLISLNHHMEDGGRPSRVVLDDKARGPHLTSVAGSLCLLHLGLVWGSYTATAWTQTHVTVAVEWQREYLPFLDSMTDQVVRTLNLASFLQDLDECRAYVLLTLLWMSALVIPCLFMVLSPTLVVGDYIRPIELQKRRVRMDGRTCLELVTRFSWIPVFALCFVSLATSLVDVELTQTAVHVGQRIRNPFVAYLTGTVCAVAMLALLRAPRRENFRIVPDEDSMEIDFSPATPVRSPPPQAFRHPWRQVEDQLEDAQQEQEGEEDEDAPLMTVLEEDVVRSPSRPSPAQRPTPPPLRSDRDYARMARRSDSNGTPELIDEDDDGEERSPSHPRPPPGMLTYWDKFTVFQLGLLSVVLWIPTMYLPLLHLSYTGVAADFIKQQSFRFYLWDIPGYLWSQGRAFGTPVWILTVLALFLFTTVLLLPILATFQAVLAWLGEGAWRTRSYVWLYTVHPCLGGMVFSVALLATIPALAPLSALLFDEHTTASSGICHAFAGENHPCLEARGQLLSGGVFYILQSLCLEVFVSLTLRWSRRP